MKITDIFRLLRPLHYCKNILILFPLLFSDHPLTADALIRIFLAMAAFSFLTSAVYIYNDLADRESDRKHPWKRRRPLASGQIRIGSAIALSVILLLLSIGILLLLSSPAACLLLLIYLLLNIAYSFYLKHFPIVDIAVLSAGFLLRIYFGAVISGVVVSHWLFLTILAASLFFSVGKRRNELKEEQSGSRAVLKRYTLAFLDKNMYLFMALTIVFYSQWCISPTNQVTGEFLWTVPLLILMLMRYSLEIERGTDGDPVTLFFSDPVLILLSVCYGGLILYLLNLKKDLFLIFSGH